MPKSKTRKGRKPAAGSGLRTSPRATAAERRRNNLWLAGGAAVVAIAVGAWWWYSAAAERDFLALAASGKAALAQVRTEPSLGRGHLQPGQTRSYPSRFPTSGSHHRVPTDPGFYTSSQAPIHLVHALEHGHIVIYYDRPGAAVLETLRRWTKLYAGHWDGVIAAPKGGLGERIVLTAWTRRLDQPKFDPAAAAAFIDAYRGRGPERPVR